VVYELLKKEKKKKKKKTVDLEGYVVCLKKLSPFSSFVNLDEKLVLVEWFFVCNCG
jgi:hypothetical protein